MDRRSKSGELNAEDRVGLLAVTAAGKETADATKGVSNKDTAGNDVQSIDELCSVVLSEDHVDAEENSRAADETANEGDAAVKTEAL